MTDKEMTILARLALLSLPVALLPRPFAPEEIETIATDANGLVLRLADEVTRLRDELDRVTAERDEARLAARQFFEQNNALQELMATSPVGMAFDNLATARAEGVEAGLLQARNAIAASGQLEPADFLAVAHILHALIPAPPAPRKGGDTITITVPRRLLREMVQWAEDELSRALEDTAFERDLRRALLLLRALDPAEPREGGEG